MTDRNVRNRPKSSDPLRRPTADLIAVIERGLRQLESGDGLPTGDLQHLANAITGAGEAIAGAIQDLGQDLEVALKDIAASACEKRR